MACCENHDRLDKVLHTIEYLGMPCGSPKNVVMSVTSGNPPSVTLNPTGETKPAYCCTECPTLIEKHKGG